MSAAKPFIRKPASQISAKQRQLRDWEEKDYEYGSARCDAEDGMVHDEVWTPLWDLLRQMGRGETLDRVYARAVTASVAKYVSPDFVFKNLRVVPNPDAGKNLPLEVVLVQVAIEEATVYDLVPALRLMLREHRRQCEWAKDIGREEGAKQAMSATQEGRAEKRAVERTAKQDPVLNWAEKHGPFTSRPMLVKALVSALKHKQPNEVTKAQKCDQDSAVAIVKKLPGTRQQLLKLIDDVPDELLHIKPKS